MFEALFGRLTWDSIILVQEFAPPILDVCLQVSAIGVFHYNMQIARCLERLDECHNVGVVQPRKQRRLELGALHLLGRHLGNGDLLDDDEAPVRIAASEEGLAKAALSHCLLNRVLLHV
jgi:hypothetical protein